jgi:urease gamma subunit
MNTLTSKHLVAATLFALCGTVAAQEAEKPVAVNTDGMPAQLRARVEEKAKEGPTAVIQYINRTRHIHNLRADQVIKPEPSSAVAKGAQDGTRVAERSDTPQK